MATFAGHRDDRLDAWARAGIVTREQVDAIRRFERDGEGVPDGLRMLWAAPTERLTVPAEVASYLGSVLALMGGALVVGRGWDQFPFIGRLALATVIALVGFVAGTWLVRLDEAGARRLGGFMWAIGTGGAAMLVAVAADRWFDANGWTLLATGTTVFFVGLALWRNRELPLQLLTVVVGFVLILSGVGDLVEIPIWVGSSVLIAAGGLLAIAAATGRLVPADLAIALGAVGAFVGGFTLGEIERHLGPFVALAVAAVVVVHALVLRRVPLLIVGLLGTLIATQAVLTTTFEGAMASLIVALVGLAVVVVAVFRTLPHDGGAAPAEPPERRPSAPAREHVRHG